MPQDTKLIASRRAYEFPPDALRLTMLTLEPVVARLQEVFKFQFAQVGTPQPTFGPVAPTLPPGLVCSMGTFVSEETGLVPVRLIHVESRRIVIDVAGPSSSIDPVLGGLTTLLGELRSPDGSPVIGPSFTIRDQSEISAHFAFPLDALLAPELNTAFRHGMGAITGTQTLIPSLTFQLQEANAEYPGTGPVTQNNGPMLQLAPRQGTRLDEQIYYSIAPLDSDAHLAYLEELEQTLTSNAVSVGQVPAKRSRRRADKANS